MITRRYNNNRDPFFADTWDVVDDMFGRQLALLPENRIAGQDMAPMRMQMDLIENDNDYKVFAGE